eukprot:XP_011663010.1 PREDICTED: probable ATP-dependent RNA helicase DDX58 isoform X1 [Strongylocentrotus purpuratus]
MSSKTSLALLNTRISYIIRAMSQRKRLRHYQEELAVPGLNGYNYIICAPTGSGKTMTAASLCHRRMVELQKQGERFKATFIVPTRHLKGQQRDAFWDIFKPTSAVAVTKTSQFRRTFDDPRVNVLMITAQILVNALHHGHFRFEELSMLVFDECHHTTQKHPYNEIMKAYMQEKKRLIDRKTRGAWLVGLPFGGLPQIVGLTASLGTGGSADAVKHVVNLCANLDCTGVVTVTDPSNVKELEGINRPPELDEIISTPPRAPSEISTCFLKTLKTLMVDMEKRFLIGKAVGDPSRPYGSILYETWIGQIASTAEQKNMSLFIAASYLLKLNMALQTYEDLPAGYVLHALEAFKEQKRLEFDMNKAGKACREMYEDRVAKLKQLARKEDPLSTPKLKELVDKLKHVFTTIPNSRGIVLARTRFATRALYDFIGYHFGYSTSKVRPTRIVGQGKEMEDAQTAAKQEAALNQFRTGEANLLIATDIVQEGLDVPACNFIIRYNFVSNEIGTVQSKGRARAQNSQCFLLVEEDSINEKREHQNRTRVRDMDAAIKKINTMDKETWLGKVGDKQLDMLGVKGTSQKATSTRASTSRSSLAIRTTANHPSRSLCTHCRKYARSGVDALYDDDEAPNHVQMAARNMLSDRARKQAVTSLSRMSAGQRQRADSCRNCGRTVTSR